MFCCLPKGRHSDGPHEFQGCSSQKCSRVGWVGHAGVGWVMQGWGGVGHAGVGWIIQGWGRVGHARVGWVGHSGVRWDGSCRSGVG